MFKVWATQACWGNCFLPTSKSTNILVSTHRFFSSLWYSGCDASWVIIQFSIYILSCFYLITDFIHPWYLCLKLRKRKTVVTKFYVSSFSYSPISVLLFFDQIAWNVFLYWVHIVLHFSFIPTHLLLNWWFSIDTTSNLLVS